GERPTEWHRIVAFGKVAEIIERYVKKGSKLYVEGEIKTRSWKDQSGSTRYITEIHCREITMMGDNSSSQDYQNSTPTSQKAASKSTTQGLMSDNINEEDDDIPF